MAHPGVAVIVVAIGIGACLYYLFSEGGSQNQRQYAHGGTNYEHSPSGNFDPWCNGTDDRSRRRKRSSTSTTKSPCTICLAELGDEEPVQKFSCWHQFHKRCITQWQQQGPEASRNNCPNCRGKISASGSYST